MAPITLAANQEVAAAAPALVNEEHNPTVTSYMACTVSRKDVSVEMVDEEHNPTVTSLPTGTWLPSRSHRRKAPLSLRLRLYVSSCGGSRR
ncbi:hypothetical protein NBRC10513_005414 [Rhodotorula toruloides]